MQLQGVREPAAGSGIWQAVVYRAALAVWGRKGIFSVLAVMVAARVVVAACNKHKCNCLQVTMVDHQLTHIHIL